MPYWFDGNNLIGQSAALARTEGETRRGFLETLGRISRTRGGKFLVFFDGEDPRHAAPPGVLIRYSAPMSTDDAILRQLEGLRHPAEVVVVTADRSLGRRCRDAGARVMDWESFSSVAQRKHHARPRPEARPEPKVNVDDWMRYFGFDKKYPQ